MSVNQELPSIKERVKRKLMEKTVRAAMTELAGIHMSEEWNPEKLVEFLQVCEKGRAIRVSSTTMGARAKLKLKQALKVMGSGHFRRSGASHSHHS